MVINFGKRRKKIKYTIIPEDKYQLRDRDYHLKILHMQESHLLAGEAVGSSNLHMWQTPIAN
jgi:hypothetical protein